jgi:cytochrome c553
MTRRKNIITALAIGAGFAVLIGPIVVTAQSTLPAEPQSLVARLTDDRTLFAATVSQPPDDDLLELGRLVAMGGARNGGSGMACITCHGGQGAGDGAGAFPRLSGQAAWYSYKQLNDYASGARPNKIMSGISQRLTEREREAVAAYYAVVRAPVPQPLGAVDQGALQWGGQLAAVGSAEKGIPACVNCHGPQGTGNPPSVPYLAGQYANYMTYQLELWKDGVRNNDAMNVMSTIAKKMTSEDMNAVSAYYNRAHNPQTTQD